MSKTLIELKEKRARYEEWLGGQEDLLRRTRENFEASVNNIESVIADYREEMAALDKAISALTPEDGNDALLADQQDTPPQSSPQASETDAAMPCTCHPDDQPPHCQHKYAAGDCQRAYRSSVLRDAVEAAGLIYWDGGECPLAEAEFVNIVLRGGGGEGGQAGSMDWEHSETQSHRNDLIAYQLQSVSNARFSEGASARRSGLQQGDNPYPAPTFDCAHESAHYKWLQGWLSADEFATDAERIGSDSLTTDDDRVALHDQPALSDEAFNALPKLDGLLDPEPLASDDQSSQASSTDATDTEPQEARMILFPENIPEPILAERKRQIDAEGWAPEHDDEHGSQILLRAAQAYRLHDQPAKVRSGDEVWHYDGFTLWPWDAQWWKPKSRRRNLERAGALALAARDCAQRVEGPGVYVGHINYRLNQIIEAYNALEPDAEASEPVSGLDSQAEPPATTEQAQSENPAAQLFGHYLAEASRAGEEKQKPRFFSLFGDGAKKPAMGEV